jgi:serine/threonine protein kinase
MGEATFGKYRLIAELGHGGMADVFLAVIAGPVGSGFTKLTVVKRLRQNLADEPEFVEMLVDEARISARLNHPNVVQTNEVGSVGDQYFLAMEYLDGQPLHRIQHRAMQKAARANAELAQSADVGSSVISPTDPFPRDCHYLVILDTLAGLHHAHELCDYDGTPLSIVHRDVTPHNVFVTYEGQVKVVDFGIAKAAGRASETRQGVVKGKVRYMAPEQAIGQAVDRRADLFSVGIMLWEASTGRRFWKDMDDLNIVQTLVSGTMKTSPREIDPSIPEPIDRICRRALAFNRDERYATAEDFRVELEDYLGSSGLLTSARRRLSSSVSDLFKDKRGEIKAVIEKQLAKLTAQAASTSDMKPVVIPLETGSSGVLSPRNSQTPRANSAAPRHSMAPSVAMGVSIGSSSVTDAATELYTGKKKVANRARLPALAVGVGLTLAAAGFVVLRGPLPQLIGAQKPAVPDEIHISILTTPQNAVVTIDHSRVWTPADAKLPRDKEKHILRVEAPDFDPFEERELKLEKDISMTIKLTQSAPVVTNAQVPAGTSVNNNGGVNNGGSRPNRNVPAPIQKAAQPAAQPAPAPSAQPAPTQPQPPPATTKPAKEQIKLDTDIWDKK